MNKAMLILLCWAIMIPATLAFGDGFAGNSGPENPPVPKAYGTRAIPPSQARIAHRITNRLERSGAWLDSRLDRLGRRVECRLDHRATRALARGRIGLANHPALRVQRIHARLDHRGDRFDFRLHRRADRIECARLARW